MTISQTCSYKEIHHTEKSGAILIAKLWEKVFWLIINSSNTSDGSS